MRRYDHKRIEKKWQKEWEKKKAHVVKDAVKGRKNEYVLTEFAYPSGNLHVGHWYAFAVPDIYARFRRAQGRNVLYPAGFDAFGLPAENAAIKNKLNPRTWTLKNIAYMKKQLASMGASFDWSREVSTIDPVYYKWTQWMFTQFFKKGLAYQKETPANWCPKDKTVLANEQVVDGKCERCGTEVEQRLMLQWNLKITDYADRLIDDLTALDWPEQIKESQRNWIGRSEGAEIDFGLDVEKKYKFVILHGYKGRPDGLWLPWAKSELESMGHEVVIPALPNTLEPVESEQIAAALAATTYDENTVLVGHSLGAVVAMKALQKLDNRIARLILIASAIDPAFPGMKKRPFHKTFAWDIDYEKLKRLAPNRLVLSDLKEPEVRIAYLKHLASELDARLVETHAEVKHFTGDKEPEVLMHLHPTIRIFTTRPDTLFGATCLVLAPEHPSVSEFCGNKTSTNKTEVLDYVNNTKKKTELERQESKEKTGVRLEGVFAINPATKERIPVYIADYVLPHYGTGAIMAVPAHDERDFEFAQKFGLPIKQVVLAAVRDSHNPPREGKQNTERKVVHSIVRDPKNGAVLLGFLKDDSWGERKPVNFVIGGVEEGESVEAAGRREILEETGYRDLAFVEELPVEMEARFFQAQKDVNRHVHVHTLIFDLKSDTREIVSEEENAKHEFRWVPEAEVEKHINIPDDQLAWRYHSTGGFAVIEPGTLVSSGEFTSMPSDEARVAMTKTFGRAKKTYRLRDWGVSRQRYWGVPIPIIHCEKCGAVPVPDKDLPVKLPEVKDYLPSGEGKSPLAKVAKWVNVKCPRCKGKAMRETDTLDTFVDSSWYFLRYIDPKNKKRFADKKKQKLWMPVDLYSGGAEHTTMHLLYSRFWHKALYDLGLVNEKEPYTRRMNRGLILGPDGQKMSKSKGNVIDPDAIVSQLGADTVRLYLAFIGPYNEPGSYPWNPDSIVGVRRFLERVWRLQAKVGESDSPRPNADVERMLHQTIKKVEEDCMELKFNTAISQMMIFLNAAEGKGITAKQYAQFVRVLAPFAPHIAEELWQLLKQKGSVHAAPWPKYAAKKLVADTITIAVQINGKTRAEAKVPQGASKEEQESAARAAAADRLAGQTVSRTIVIPGRLINFVL